MKRSQKLISFILFIVLSALALPLSSLAADAEFEKSLSAFPKSYHADLRKLHELHPNWSFNAFQTGLDWNTAVDYEMTGGRSLFPSSCASLFKSVKDGDYNYSSGSYIQKDYGFVTANRLAVSYYMDPRNFLNEYSIFQFEDLSYDESFDEKAVEYVLRGTFMYNTKISYYDTNGKLIKTNEKYSSVICQAGKKANINPCYLAAKIRGEVGSGTSATSGKNSTYPGIYNFYNIGATDGAGAIERGLYWAKNGTTYSRPWTSPKKSIIGGAQFVSSSYIAQGQFTAYLQKFNVNPQSSYGVYNHQYMTNVCAAALQAYFSFDSYDSANLLENRFSFSIPVFKNMDDATGTSGKTTLTDASGLSGIIDTNGSINVRKGPSTNNERLDFQLPSGTSVTILDIVETDALYYLNVLNYPFWYKISFTYQSKKYTGFVPKSFVSITSSVGVSPGKYEPSFSGKGKLHLLSFNEKVAKIDGDIIEFLKEGTVEIAAYDSTGKFSITKYTVTDTGAPAPVTGLRQSATTASSFTLSWNKVSDATGYTVYKYNNSTKAFVPLKTTRATKLAVAPGSPGSSAVYAVKTRKKVGDAVFMSDFSKNITAATLPAVPEGLSQSNTVCDGFTLSWQKVGGAYGYVVYKLDESSGRFLKIAATRANSFEVFVSKPLTTEKFKVRAYLKASAGNLYGAYSKEFSAVSAPPAVQSVSLSAVVKNGYTLSWSSVNRAEGYAVFRFSPSKGKFEHIATTPKTSYTVKNQKTGSSAIYCIKAFIKKDGLPIYSTSSREISAATLPETVGKLSQKKTAATGYTLSWAKVAGADGYKVFKYDNAKKRYVFLKDTEENSLKIGGLKAASTAKYKVRSFVKIGNRRYYAPANAEFEAITAPAAVGTVKAKVLNSSSYKLSWNKVSKAYGYRIFRYDAKTKSYVKVATIRGNSYNVKALKGAKEEKLIVRAFIRHGGNYFGNASKPVTVKLK